MKTKYSIALTVSVSLLSACGGGGGGSSSSSATTPSNVGGVGSTPAAAKMNLLNLTGDDAKTMTRTMIESYVNTLDATAVLGDPTFWADSSDPGHTPNVEYLQSACPSGGDRNVLWTDNNGVVDSGDTIRVTYDNCVFGNETLSGSFTLSIVLMTNNGSTYQEVTDIVANIDSTTAGVTAKFSADGRYTISDQYNPNGDYSFGLVGDYRNTPDISNPSVYEEARNMMASNVYTTAGVDEYSADFDFEMPLNGQQGTLEISTSTPLTIDSSEPYPTAANFIIDGLNNEEMQANDSGGAQINTIYPVNTTATGFWDQYDFDNYIF